MNDGIDLAFAQKAAAFVGSFPIDATATQDSMVARDSPANSMIR
jgi:hypothetical protein